MKDFISLVDFQRVSDLVKFSGLYEPGTSLMDGFNEKSIQIQIMPNDPVPELDLEEYTPSHKLLLVLTAFPTTREEKSIF